MTTLRALLCAAMLLSGCGSLVREFRKDITGLVAPPPADLGRARTAWSYFAANGPSEAARGAGFATPVSIGADIAATIAARRIGLIRRDKFDRRTQHILAFLAAVPLSGGVLPGRYYDLSGHLVDPSDGVADPGWSAVEIGQLLVWLRVLAATEPRYAGAVDVVMERWQICRAVANDGRLVRAQRESSSPSGKFVTTLDTGTGYADYAALGLRGYGVDARGAPHPAGDFLIEIEVVSLPLFAGLQVEPVLTTPAALTAMLFGWIGPDGGMLSDDRRMATALATAQERRNARGVPTARNSYSRGSAPFQVQDTILGGGFPWTTTADGAVRPDLALVSVQAAFGLRALTGRRAYGEQMVALVDALQGSSGWLEGSYESGIGPEPLQTATTNALVLTAILHRQAGRLYPKTTVKLSRCENAQ